TQTLHGIGQRIARGMRSPGIKEAEKKENAKRKRPELHSPAEDHRSGAQRKFSALRSVPQRFIQRDCRGPSGPRKCQRRQAQCVSPFQRASKAVSWPFSLSNSAFFSSSGANDVSIELRVSSFSSW